MDLKLAALLAAALMSTGCFTAPLIDLGDFGRAQPLSEITIQGEGESKIVLLEIEGVISYKNEGFSFAGQRPSIVSRLSEALDLAAKDSNVECLILRIRSPGGGVAASETLHHLVMDWKQKSQKPVIAYFQGLAASGGYYVGMAADEVIAHPASVTGSIGVIMPGFNLAGLMDKIGVGDQSLTSGDFKDSGTMLRPMREEERKQLQSVVDDLYGRFVDVVAEGRPKLDRDRVLELADGRIYSANQALEAGLVDRLGHMDDVIQRAEEMAKVSSAKVISYRSGGRTITNIYSGIASKVPDTSKTEVSLISLGAVSIPAGFYYLWPMALP